MSQNQTNKRKHSETETETNTNTHTHTGMEDSSDQSTSTSSSETPFSKESFENVLTNYTSTQRSQIQQIFAENPTSQSVLFQLLQIVSRDGMNAKKKLKTSPHEEQKTHIDTNAQLICSISNVSFMTPRKKLKLEISSTRLQLKGPGDKLEGDIPFSQLQHVFCVVSPNNPQQRIVIFFCGASSANPYSGEASLAATFNADQLNAEINEEWKNELPDQTTSCLEFWKVITSKVFKLKEGLIEDSLNVFQSSSKRTYIPCHQKVTTSF